MSGSSKVQGRWGEPMRYSLNELEAFEVMRAFVEAFWRRDGANMDDGLAKLLSFTDRQPWPSGR